MRGRGTPPTAVYTPRMADWFSTMDWQFELILAARAALAALLGGAIGFERQWQGREAGVRTYAAVAMGACIFSLLGLHALPQPTPIIAGGVVTGVGFLGAGIILRESGHVVGLTTAASVWVTGAVGMLMGFGMYMLAALCTAMLIGILLSHEIPWLKRFRRVHQPGSRQGEDAGRAGDDQPPSS